MYIKSYSFDGENEASVVVTDGKFELICYAYPFKSSLSMQIMQRIKQEYSYLNNIKLENLNLEYFGNYNGYYAVIMYDITTGVAAVVTKVEIGDVLFYYPTTGIEIIMCKIN